MTDPIKRGGGAGPVDPSAGSGVGEASGPRSEAFRETLQAERASTSQTQDVQGLDELNQLAGSMRSGSLTPEQVVEALVARQLQSSAARGLAPAQRAELESLLRSRLSDDPTLLALGRDLSRGR